MKDLMRIQNALTSADDDLIMKETINLLSSMFGPIGGAQFFMPMFDLPMMPVKVKYDERVKFSFYGDTGNSNNHKGIIVIAALVNEKERVVHYGSAFCSPKDVYDKAKGKELAFKDLDDNMNTVVMMKKAHHAVNAAIFADMIAYGLYPSWAKTQVIDAGITHLKGSKKKTKKEKEKNGNK